jgi:hypothetical protein
MVSCRPKSQTSVIWNFFCKETFSREELLQAGRALIFNVYKVSVKGNTDIWSYWYREESEIYRIISSSRLVISVKDHKSTGV